MTGGSGKTLAALVAGAVATLVVSGLHQGLHWTITPEVSNAIQILSTALAVHLIPSGGDA